MGKWGNRITIDCVAVKERRRKNTKSGAKNCFQHNRFYSVTITLFCSIRSHWPGDNCISYEIIIENNVCVTNQTGTHIHNDWKKDGKYICEREKGEWENEARKKRLTITGWVSKNNKRRQKLRKPHPDYWIWRCLQAVEW